MKNLIDYAITIKPVEKVGINDGLSPGSKAYLEYDDEQDWSVIVFPDNKSDIYFLPIDNNKFFERFDNNKNLLKRCDALLFTHNSLFFVEIKNEKQSWITECIEQLKATIESWNSMIDFSCYKYKRAYAANKMHPKFAYSQKTKMQKFYQETGFKLFIENTIRKIK